MSLIPSQMAGVVSLLPFPRCRLAGASKGPTSQEGGRLLSCLPPEVVPWPSALLLVPGGLPFISRHVVPGACGSRLLEGVWDLTQPVP